MTPERWQQIEDLFNAALKRPESERPTFLNEVCRDDHELRLEIETLLYSDQESDKLNESLPSEVAAQMLADRQSAGLVGRTIGRYLVLSELGAGGMGEVYLAEDSSLKRKVAIKVLPHLYTSDPERVHRFEQEARAASALNHPHIITIYEIGQWQRSQFIVTEYIDGLTLRQRVEKRSIELEELLEIAVQASSALAAAHEAGIVHRDIKPANIMVRADGYLKILDFGLAKLTASTEASGGERKTDPGRVMGTIQYMSPEQALGNPVDARTDIFSLGVVLYELASGKLPFSGNSDAAIYNSLLSQAPASLEEAPLKLPFPLAKIIKRTLEKNPDLRYQSAGELHSELKKLQGDSRWRQAPAPRISNYSRLVRPALAGALFLLLFGVGAYWLKNWWTQRSTSNVTPVSSTTPHFAFTQQTDQPGTEYFPTLSPDGQLMAYASQESGNWDLWLETMADHQRVNLTANSPVDDLQPAFSPDGKLIAFRSEREKGGLFTLDIATKSVRKVSPQGFNPSWSPDGSEIAYGTASVTFVEARTDSQLWVVRVSTGEQRLVTAKDAVQPAWSPNGQRIAYWSDRADLWTIPAGGGEPVRVTHEKVNWNPCWSADGKYLYFTSDRNGSTNLWRVAVDENSGKVLHESEPATTPATDMVHLAISRDGRRIAYVQRTKQRRLESISFDPATGLTKGGPTTITKGTSFATHPSVSPDGKWLAYSSSGGPREDIFIVKTDGTGVRQLTNDAAKDRLPRWSPDGKRIAFFSDREGKNEIWAISIEDQKVEQLTFTGRRAIYPVWSPDGNQLVYYDWGLGSFIVDLRKPWQAQTPQPVMRDGKIDPNLTVYDWSSDGKRLACVNLPTSPQKLAISIYEFGESDTSSRFLDIVGQADLPRWLSDGRRLIYLAGDKLYLIDVETRATHEVFAPGSNQTAEYPTLSPDNRTLYFSLATTEADIWLATIE